MLTLSSHLREAAPRPVLDGDLVITEHAIATLRSYLREANLSEWRIFNGPLPYVYSIDLVLDRLDPDAVWECADESLVAAEAMVAVTFEDEPKPRTRAWPSGVLHLRKMQAIIARWYWYDVADSTTHAFYLLAAPQVECIEALRQRMLTLNRQGPQPMWQIAGQYGPAARKPRELVSDDALLLTDTLRKRVEIDVLGFFTPGAAAMYKRLGVPYRRGVLLWGEPGNGKTSLIRWVGAKLPNVAAIVLRAAESFDTDTLIDTFDTWKQMAPAILVIEDLTAVLEKVNLSTFLNLLDGVDRKADGGLMLIASTNHPDKLDTAVSNRPGRFDVVIELPPPDEAQRQAYLRSKLLEMDVATLDAAVSVSREMSFAHLEEIVHLSGMIAIQDGREFRLAADVNAAVDHVRRAFNTARRGYTKLPEAPFGLANFRGD
ncbi:MAG: ATPase, partial [Phycisphaerales bacterium]|nr:ATPase [Phycisphaerales bacterium]